MEMNWLTGLFRPEVLLPFLTFIIPGFMVWWVVQARLPRGSQSPGDVIFEIIAYGFAKFLYCGRSCSGHRPDGQHGRSIGLKRASL